MLPPPESIGVEDPMFVSGAMPRKSAASAIQTPAEPAVAPFGPTHTSTGSLAFSSQSTILSFDCSRPPGVLSTITAAE